MSFVRCLKEEVGQDPSNNASNSDSGNVSLKHPMLRQSADSDLNVQTINTDDFDEVEDMIHQNHITLDKKTVEIIIDLVEKTVKDWNRKENVDNNQIKRILVQALNKGIIKFD